MTATGDPSPPAAGDPTPPAARGPTPPAARGPTPPAARGRSTSSRGTPYPVDLARDRRDRVIWVVFIGGPVIWFTHFMVVYLVAEAGCTGDGPGLDVFDHPVPTGVSLGATAVAALACAGLARWAFARWRAGAAAVGGGAPLSGDVDDGDGRGSLAFTGMLLSLLSLVTVLFVGLPAPFLPAC
jgi:hypothetical protein